MFYNIAQPSNIAAVYSEYSQVDFTCKPGRGRAVQANSFRLSGLLNVQKMTYGATSFVDVEPEDQVFMNPFIGAHGIIKNISSVANDRILENISFYPRIVGSMTQAKCSLEELTSSSEHAVELKGLQSNVLLGAGTDVVLGVPSGSGKAVPFSLKPMVALNRSSADLGQSKFSQMKLLMTLGSAVESFYCTKQQPADTDPTRITGLTFNISNLQLSWIEVPEVSIPRIVFRTIYLTTQTIVSLNSNIYVTSPTTFDSVSVSVIKQVNRNSVYKDNNLCEYLRAINRLEFTIDGVDAPLVYGIGASSSPPYQDIALNYCNSLEASDRNCLMNKLLSESIAWGFGCSFRAQQNSKLAISINIDTSVPDAANPSKTGNAYDAFLYCHGYLEA